MAELTIDDRELRGLVKRLEKAGKYTAKSKRRVLSAIGAIVKGRAVSYAPISMTKQQYESTLVGGKTKRSTSSFTSGALKSSITAEVKSDSVHIGVPSNSKAGEYAEKMHDGRGKTWRKLQKFAPPEARDKFIYAAQEDTEKEYLRAVDKLVENIIREI